MHGGGWVAGDRTMERAFAKHLAARGYVAVPVSYRLGEPGRFPHSILDLKTAVRWLRAHAAEHGIKLGSVKLDLATLLKKKDSVVTKLVGGVAQLAKARKITVITGAAAFVSPNTIRVAASASEPTELTAKNIVIATGSAPVELPFMKFDGETVVSSDHAIQFTSVPKKLVVVGGGAIGLELGSVWSRLGADVTVVEFLPKIVATYDDDIIRNFTRILQKQGLKIEVGAKVTGFQRSTAGATGILTAERGTEKLAFPADKVLVAVGRRPFTDSLNLAAAGVQCDERIREEVVSHALAAEECRLR